VRAHIEFLIWVRLSLQTPNLGEAHASPSLHVPPPMAVPQTILIRMNELKMQGCEVIIYILNQVGDDIYHAIKYFGNVKIGKRYSSSSLLRI
jgi:hypothetical protein